MSTPVFRGVVSDTGELLLEARGLFKAVLGKLAGKRVVVTVLEEKPPKSQAQLGYLFGVLYPFVAKEICGYTDYESTRKDVIDAVHDGVMRALGKMRPEPNPLAIRQSIREWDQAQVSAYVEEFRTWAVIEHGCVTPDAQPATKRASAA